MSLTSIQLDAFVAVAKLGTFSGAAKALNITQAALSQRILNLEDELGSTLFIREPSGIRLTELGQRFLRYCQMKDKLEAEFLGELSQSGQSLRGLIRIGSYSTIVRSVLVPCVSLFLAKNPEVQVEIFTKELRELRSLLEMTLAPKIEAFDISTSGGLSRQKRKRSDEKITIHGRTNYRDFERS